MSTATVRRVGWLTRIARNVLAVVSRVPAPVVRVLARRAPTNAAGDRLAPEIYLGLRALSLLPKLDLAASTPAEARIALEKEALLFADRFEAFAIEEDLAILGGVQPIEATRFRHRADFSRGLVVFFHGGGWALGSRVTHESAARFLAVEAGVDVLLVYYRLAPEHPFPAAIDDALVVWRFAVEHARDWGFGPQQIVIAGDSAGGNITATLAQLIRGEEIQPALQVLIYPVTDVSRKHPSRHEFGDGFFLTDEQMDWYEDRYLRSDDDRLDPRVSPLLADDVAGVAPALIVVAGFDPLRDEGIAYAEKLRADRVPTQLLREGELIHAFINVTAVSMTARNASVRIAQAVAAALTGPTSGILTD